MRYSLLLLLILMMAGCSVSEKTAPASEKSSPQLSENTLPQKVFSDERALKLIKARKAIEPFFELMGEPKPDEWLAGFKEPGQTFEEYINGNPTLPTEERQTIYIQPIGDFNDEQHKVINLTAEYMEKFFGLPVKSLKARQLDKKLSPDDYRVYWRTNTKQLRTGYFLEKVLPQILPKNAAALIAFTSEDLYPDESMSYVFGQASLEKRVGVWSLYRLNYDKNFKLFLTRTFKIATHETGHMFTMLHCKKYQCEMSGSNHLKEVDSHPLDACPECMAKICWMKGYEPQKRYESLAEFFTRQGYTQEAEDFKAKALAVKNALEQN